MISFIVERPQRNGSIHYTHYIVERPPGHGSTRYSQFIIERPLRNGSILIPITSSRDHSNTARLAIHISSFESPQRNGSIHYTIYTIYIVERPPETARRRETTMIRLDSSFMFYSRETTTTRLDLDTMHTHRTTDYEVLTRTADLSCFRSCTPCSNGRHNIEGA
jgi:hypothetical protein